MVIWMFVLKVINNETKILTHHEINDCIEKQIESVITCAKNQNCGFILTYGSQVSHFLIQLSSLTLV